VTSLALVLAGLVAATLSAEPLPPSTRSRSEPTPRGDRAPGTGSVLYATAARAYVDAGGEDGLAVGAEVALRRRGADAGTCRVEAIGPRQATCTGAAARPGDAIRFAPAAPVAAPPPARELPPLPTAEALAADRAALDAAPVTAVEYRPPERPAVARRAPLAEVAFGHASWLATSARSRHAERVDLIVHGAELGAGFALDLDARAERWTGLEDFPFRPGDPTRLYVWQAQLSGAWEGSPLSVAAGRVLPWSVPGATVLDGALVSLRRGRSEVGLFGGGVPEPDTLAPTLERATAGGFWAIEGRAGNAAFLRQEARIATVRAPELGTRAELDLAGRASFGARLDVGAGARLGLGGDVSAPSHVDAARVDLTTRPIRALVLGGRFEYQGLDVPEAFSPPVFPGRSRRADGFATVDVFRYLRLGAVGGFARDLSSALERRWLGPELMIPRLLGDRLQLSLGYLAESGWLEGRSAWLQATARPIRSLRLAARASWSREDSLGADRDHLGAGASIAAQLTPRVAFRLGVDGRATTDGEPGGLTALAGLDAAY
jgi:hypothetical protein